MDPYETTKEKVFISYSSLNKNVADAVVSNFEQHGIRCWYAPRDIMPGQQWVTAIHEAINTCMLFVLIYTDSSNESKQVANEVALAFNSGKILIPFRLSDTEMNTELEYYLTRVHWLDAVNPSLMQSIEALREYSEKILTGNLPKEAKVRNAVVPVSDKRFSYWIIPAVVAIIGVVVVAVVLILKNNSVEDTKKVAENVTITDDGNDDGRVDVKVIEINDEAVSETDKKNAVSDTDTDLKIEETVEDDEESGKVEETGNETEFENDEEFDKELKSDKNKNSDEKIKSDKDKESDKEINSGKDKESDKETKIDKDEESDKDIDSDKEEKSEKKINSEKDKEAEKEIKVEKDNDSEKKIKTEKDKESDKEIKSEKDNDTEKDANTENDPASFYVIAYDFQTGNNEENHFERAYDNYMKTGDALTSDTSIVKAIYELGMRFANGDGVEQDYDKAITLYKKAMDCGSIEAINSLGNLYYNGDGVDEDYAAALSFYLLAASKDDPVGLYNCGYMYENGYGTEADPDKAIEYYKRAKDKDYSPADKAYTRLTSKK